MKIHLIDATYELFRAFYGAPPTRAPDGAEVGATLGLVRSLLALLRGSDVTHVACAFDNVIESFRNQLYAGYKTGEGVDPQLRTQFSLAEEAVRALGIVVWSMVEFEADDALATAAARWRDAPGVHQVVVASPDKDLAQCVRGERVVLWDRRRQRTYDADGVVEKYGVRPESIPDWLALVGDDADGIPGLRCWGRKSAAAVLMRYPQLEDIPEDESRWDVKLRGASALAEGLRQHRAEVMLYRRLTILRTDVPLDEELGDLEWRGARRRELGELCRRLGDDRIVERVPAWRD
ncbi:MAG: flap endonuclease [bacterium]|nr:flap endonuclease [bacterium]